uniref:7TM GPCR serpentine receptor class x (Srx) domain-containing protein n=1 Tax=Acrobeloides nanus TaxID=290746 RepID=A0A914DUA0_9BILA
MAIYIPSLIGIVLTALSSTSLLINLFVLFILYRGGLLKPSKSNIYLLAFASIMSNCIRASIIAFYMGPSVILQTYIFSDGPYDIINGIISYMENATWNVDMLISTTIAINRVSVIVFTNSVKKCVRQYLENVSFSTSRFPLYSSHKQSKGRYSNIRIPLSKSLKILQHPAAPHITPEIIDSLSQESSQRCNLMDKKTTNKIFF